MWKNSTHTLERKVVLFFFLLLGCSPIPLKLARLRGSEQTHTSEATELKVSSLEQWQRESRQLHLKVSPPISGGSFIVRHNECHRRTSVTSEWLKSSWFTVLLTVTGTLSYDQS